MIKCMNRKDANPLELDLAPLYGINNTFYSALGDRKGEKAVEMCFFTESRPVYRVGLVIFPWATFQRQSQTLSLLHES